MPHLHGFLDGTMVTLKILEERLGEVYETFIFSQMIFRNGIHLRYIIFRSQPIGHSTPERRISDPLTPCQEHLMGLAYGPREDERVRRLE